MKKNSKDIYQDVEDFFNAEPTANEKAWSLIHDFYHLILSEMEEKGIKQIEIANKLGKSKASVSKMLNNTPNITVRKMVELADCVGIDIKITTDQIEKQKEEEIVFEQKKELKANLKFILHIDKDTTKITPNSDLDYDCDNMYDCPLVSESFGGYNG